MPLENNSVWLAEQAFIYTAPIGTTPPTDAQIQDFDADDPDAFETVTRQDEIQTVTITGTPTGGTFTLTFLGQTTAAIAYNAAAAAVQTALLALSTLDTGDVTVTGGPGPATPWVANFSGGQYDNLNVPQMTATGSFTGGTTPTVAVTTGTEGGVVSGSTGWVHLGHTDLDEDLEGDEEGGKTEVRGTRQVPNLRTRDEPVTDFFTANVVQWTTNTLSLYYGGGTVTAGRFVAPKTSRAQELMVLVIFVDGTRNLGRLHRKCSVKRGGPVSTEAENFIRAPLRFTPLDPDIDGTSHTEWISIDAFAVA